MLTSQRKQLILSRLRADGQIIAKTLSEELGLSEDTIRRDLRELAQDGHLLRVHGGALPASPAVVDLAGREKLASTEKRAIARAAAALIQPGQVVILDGGTTTRELALMLPPALRVTIVTHSPTIASALETHPTAEVILLGGRLFKHSMVAVGAATMNAISHLRADLFFLGVTGVHQEAGLTTGDFEEAHIKGALMRAAAETCVLASPEKLNAASAFQICPLAEIDSLIVPAGLAPEILAPFRRFRFSILEA